MHTSLASRPSRLALGLAVGGLLGSFAAAHAQGFYRQTNLVSDPNLTGVARGTDQSLINPWGLSHSSTSPWWVSDNGTGVSTLYNGQGVPQSLVVTIPPPAGSPEEATAAPTGNVFNPTTGFVVTLPCPDPSSGCQDQPSGPSRFLFATENGTLSSWNPTVDPKNAILTVDNSAKGAVYKGLAIASTKDKTFPYATNFHDGVVEIYDDTFTFVKSFTDPDLMTDAQDPEFAPFGIQAIGDRLYVTFAMQDEQRHDDVKGPGSGFIDVFDLYGNDPRRLATGDPLNSPWGVALAPRDFGQFSHALIVGNFGDGQINAFDPDPNPTKSTLMGPLTKRHGQGIAINGLWGLSFGKITVGRERH